MQVEGVEGVQINTPSIFVVVLVASVLEGVVKRSKLYDKLSILFSVLDIEQ